MDEPLFKVVNKLRKQGDLHEAWDVGCPAVQQVPNDAYLKGAFFWVCYDFLKQVHSQVKGRADENDREYKVTHSELDRINFLIDWIVWLDIPDGGFEYRSLLLLFQRYLESIPKLVVLLAHHVDSLFDAGDEEPYQGENGESPSLMLKFARSMAKAWLSFEEVQQIDLDHVLLIFEKTRAKAKDKQHMMWLDYDQAKLLIVAGRNEEARALIIPVLRKKQSEPWAWGAFAATYRDSDENTALCLFAKGIRCAHDEKFALRLLKGMARILVKQGNHSVASMCLIRLTNWYESNGFKLKADVEQFKSAPWFNPAEDISRLDEFLKDKSAPALQLLTGPTTKRLGVVSNIHKSVKKLELYLSESERVSVSLRLFDGKEKPALGDCVEVTISSADNEKNVVEARRVPLQKVSGVENIQGFLRVTPGGFGFVEDTFVPASLIKDGMETKNVKILRHREFDKKRNKPGWKAVVVEVLE